MKKLILYQPNCHASIYSDENKDEFMMVTVEGELIGKECSGCEKQFQVDDEAYLQITQVHPPPDETPKVMMWCTDCVEIVTLQALMSNFGQQIPDGDGIVSHRGPALQISEFDEDTCPRCKREEMDIFVLHPAEELGEDELEAGKGLCIYCLIGRMVDYDYIIMKRYPNANEE